MKHGLAVLALAFMMAPFSAHAETIGKVKRVDGDANIQRGERTVVAEQGLAVERGDLLVTGRDGSLGVTLNDGTLIAAGPNTELSVDDFAYEPPNGEHSMVATLTKGTLNYLSGQIAEFSSNAVAVNVPAGTIAVRGTHLVIEVEPAQ